MKKMMEFWRALFGVYIEEILLLVMLSVFHLFVKYWGNNIILYLFNSYPQPGVL